MPWDPEEHRAVEAALLRRAEEAIEAAERIRERSEVVLAISTSLRESGMTTRCAWCGRHRINGRWVLVERAPDVAHQAGVTHGICADCFAALRATGMSV